ncbi:uncharacterized protein LY89DRAFT_693021 [Mollisia scopiformis]|uniref:Metallo-beta-lactamase domain-containing protein n=1 Tax=Mollisia scopiformis TaxID=149040 RepID=A0A194XX06_MOLSC|nr:uncharacterized protein LY89DRAFT_693021 [Mollisia scopiformis]KUJ24302.1 hypothetical protein LY89DRAFT_693021 [Mollisia scopiformis]
MSSSLSTSFVSRRVNDSTFLIIEDDSYGEEPHIYVKIYPDHLLITDTGCDSPRKHGLALTSLREYIETVPLPLNGHQVLNPNGSKHYIIICSHCHYDHILGIPQFLTANPTIIASSFSKSFLAQENLPTNSLCKYINKPTPQYTITHWAHHLSYFSLPNIPPFRIQFLHIPGHTPDSLAWYDIDEHHLYVGDTIYERKRSTPIPELPDDAGQVPGLPATQAAIIFPDEGGDWIAYMSSLSLLLSFTTHKNDELKKRGSEKRVKVACGHLTYEADAEDMILQVKGLFERIIAGKVSVKRSGVKRGVVHDFWLEDEGEGSKYSVMAPRRLFEEARRFFHPEIGGS